MAGSLAVVRSLDHLVLTCTDVSTTSNWYSKYLGMTVETFNPPSAPHTERIALKFGSQKINLHQKGKEFEPKATTALPGTADLCFLIQDDADLDAILEGFKGDGIEVLEGGKVTQRTGAQGPINSIYVRDPDGNLIDCSFSWLFQLTKYTQAFEILAPTSSIGACSFHTAAYHARDPTRQYINQDTQSPAIFVTIMIPSLATISSKPLPAEILLQIAQYLDNDTLKSFRLVSRAASTIATERLFRVVLLRLTKGDFITDEDMTPNGDITIVPNATPKNLNAILESDTLKKLVKKVVIDGDNGAHWMEKEEDEYGDFIDDYVETAWSGALGRIYQFPYLREVDFAFNGIAGLDMDGEFEQDDEYREYYQRLLFATLSKTELLDSLSIRNIQDALITHTGPDEASMLVREKLKKLALMVVTETMHVYSVAGLGDLDIDAPAFHECFNSGLTSHWLKPTQQQLTHLTLYCDSYWGIYPFTDLRGIHFPHLKSLSLGRWTIAHDWQHEWVTSHGDTLEELVLDDCPIVYALKMEPKMADANWPDMQPPDGWGEIDTNILKQYGTRWSDILPTFQHGLKHLRSFGMACRPFDDETYSHEVMFNTRYDIPARIEASRYTNFAYNSIDHTQWYAHVDRAAGTGKGMDCWVTDRKMEKEAEQEEGDHFRVSIKNEHGHAEELQEPDAAQRAADEAALSQLLRAMGRSEHEISRMKGLEWHAGKGWRAPPSPLLSAIQRPTR
ncbi:hypothetical protein N0V90_006378 [Kalmusia sp. IMI 367209]|nr:hypothetical protein N0V90_006378 [Kalmusia sp. IMI 367209]